jgi:hypothetical protein
MQACPKYVLEALKTELSDKNDNSDLENKIEPIVAEDKSKVTKATQIDLFENGNKERKK